MESLSLASGGGVKMANVKITFFDTGYCTTIERIVLKTGKLQVMKCPATCALIQHPLHGLILFDTGYANYVKAETYHFPYRLYRWLTPMFFHEEKSVANQLKARGIHPDDIKAIIVSHFHADHIGGLKDFKKANFIYLQEAYENLKGLTGMKALSHGYLSGLLPEDFEIRSFPINAKKTNTIDLPYQEFPKGYDLLGDRSLISVHLPGHAKGQMGLFVLTQDRGIIFLAADACWHSRAYRELEGPHPIAKLILNNYQEYMATLEKLHTFHRNHPEITIIPTHCPEVYAKLFCEKRP